MTTPKLARLINGLHRALRAEYGADFAYTILGRGLVIGASDYHHGYIKPETTQNARGRRRK